MCGLSLVVASWGDSLAAVCSLLIAVTPLGVELGLGAQASVVVVYRLSCSAAYRIFLDQG